MSRFDDRLADYVDVKERIRLFYEKHPDGRLMTGDIKMLGAEVMDGTPRIAVQALAYRTPDDPLPGVGWSWMVLPGSTPYTRGSELENVETSAWGRAIGSLGIGIDKSVTSRDEINAKSTPPPDAPPPPDDGSLIGTAEVGKVGSGADFELRQTPEGPALAFRLTQGRKGWKVIAHGGMAVALAALKPVGQRVSVWGSMQDESMPISGGRTATYQVVNLERIKGDEFDLPTPEEAPSLALFPDGAPLTAEEQAEILESEMREAGAK